MEGESHGASPLLWHDGLQASWTWHHLYVRASIHPFAIHSVIHTALLACMRSIAIIMEPTKSPIAITSSRYVTVRTACRWAILIHVHVHVHVPRRWRFLHIPVSDGTDHYMHRTARRLDLRRRSDSPAMPRQARGACACPALPPGPLRRDREHHLASYLDAGRNTQSRAACLVSLGARSVYEGQCPLSIISAT